MNPVVRLRGESDVKARLRSRAARNLIFMGRKLWPLLFSFLSPAFHREICRVFQDVRINRINIKAPRAGAKSSLTQLLVLWHIFFEDRFRVMMGFDKEYTARPKLVVIASETQDLAIRLLAGLKTVLASDECMRLTGIRVSERQSVRYREDEISFHYQGQIVTVVCKGMGQTLRGIREGVSRVTLFIGDDLESENNTKTPESMDANLSWLLSAADYSVDEASGRAVNLATPQNTQCICMKLEKGWTPQRTKAGGSVGQAETGWFNMIYPALVDMGLSSERSLWPEKWSREFLRKRYDERKAVQKLSLFMREMQCIPTGDEESPFPPATHGSYIGYLVRKGAFNYMEVTHMGHPDVTDMTWTPPPVVDEDGAPTTFTIPVNVFGGVDPAVGKSRKASSAVVLHLAVDNKDNKFVLPYWASKGKRPSQLVARVIREKQKYNPRWIRVEDVGFQVSISNGIKKKAPDIHCKTYKAPEPMQMEMDFADKTYFMPWQGADLLRHELLHYPFSTYDVISALWGAQNKRFPPTHAYNPEEKPPDTGLPGTLVSEENFMTA